MNVILNGGVEGIKTRVDGSLVFSIATQEMDADACGKLFQFRGKYVKCLLSDKNITEIEAELVDKERMVDSRKNKSQAQRLRAVLFLVHTTNGGSKDTFDEFYSNEMEMLINHYKEKIA